LSEIIFEEQFDFLFKRQIHEVMALAQEVMHSMKTSKVSLVLLKLNLRKAYDKVSWIFLRLVLIQMGMNLAFVNWIMGCIQFASFVVPIHDSPSCFFGTLRGLKQGFPLSPFLILVEGLSKLIRDIIRRVELKGLKVSPCEYLSHLLFVDDFLMFGASSLQEFQSIRRIMDLFYSATGMEIN
jgi:hypothetical protein